MDTFSKLPSLFLLFALLVGCATLGSFTFTEESEVITIRGERTLPTPMPLADLFPTTIPLEVDLEQELAAQDASGARSIHLTELYFELTDDSRQETFDFLNRITLTVGPQDSSSELPSQELAIRNPIPEGESRFYLDVDDQLNLKPYVEEGLRLQTNVTGSAPSSEARFKVFATFRVRVL